MATFNQKNQIVNGLQINSTANNGWISVEDRLPITEDTLEGNYDCVSLFAYDGKSVFPSSFSAGNAIKFWSNFEHDGITHWMIPEPPDAQ